MTPNFNVIRKYGQKVSNQSDVDYDKQTAIVNNPYN